MYRELSLRAILFSVLLGAIGVTTHSALAVEPANIQAGPLYIAPTLDVKTGYVDNLLRSGLDDKGTWASEVTPRVQAWLQEGVNTYSLTYKAVDSRYGSSHSDDYTDQQVNLDLHHEFSSRSRLNVIGEYYDGHEQRGTGLTDGLGQIVDKPVEYERATFGGDFTYGNSVSRGRLNLEAKRARYEFQNFRDFTRFRDRDQDTVGATFFWQIAAKTNALFQLRAIDNTYDETNPESSLGAFDSEEYNYLVGISWDATGRTSGSVKVGLYDREYDSSARADDDGFQWEVDLKYMPRSYSSINFATRRYSQETNGRGDSINTQEYKLGWDHDWSSRSTTRFGILAGSEEYSGTAREDDRFDLEASYNFAPRRWLDLGVGLRREDRDSNELLFDYTRNVYFIEARLSL